MMVVFRGNRFIYYYVLPNLSANEYFPLKDF
jgi:hypothetical protein